MSAIVRAATPYCAYVSSSCANFQKDLYDHDDYKLEGKTPMNPDPLQWNDITYACIHQLDSPLSELLRNLWLRPPSFSLAYHR